MFGGSLPGATTTLATQRLYMLQNRQALGLPPLTPSQMMTWEKTQVASIRPLTPAEILKDTQEKQKQFQPIKMEVDVELANTEKYIARSPSVSPCSSPDITSQNSTSPSSFFKSDPVIERLRKHKAYEIANNSKKFENQCIVMGRGNQVNYPYREKQYYAEAKQGQQLYLSMNPHAEGMPWDLDWNMAFWLGGIEANKTFLLLTDITDVLKRARRHVHNPHDGIGGTVAEILWLHDNGYTFAPCSTYSTWTVAIPPQIPRTVFVMRPEYDKWRSDFAEVNVRRLAALCNQIETQRHLIQRANPINLTL
jgi:hypothetical protein